MYKDKTPEQQQNFKTLLNGLIGMYGDKRFDPHFDNGFWCSFTEYKRYGALSELANDTQKVIIELNLGSVRLVFFADESDTAGPDISHVTITKDEIVEIRPDGWR